MITEDDYWNAATDADRHELFILALVEIKELRPYKDTVEGIVRLIIDNKIEVREA